jgi:ribonuclease HII
MKQQIKVIIDCPSVNTVAWKNTLLKFLVHNSNLAIHCEHKADVNHVSASAASILAKVTREEEVAKIKAQFKEYGNIGSGYPSDPLTKEFLKKNGKKLANSGIFRKTWSTWKAFFPSVDEKQKKLF